MIGIRFDEAYVTARWGAQCQAEEMRACRKGEEKSEAMA